ncbi:MAG: metallophosphoesterase [Methanofastidiosum sp.]
MARNLVISDPHLAHENIIKYCNRPFKNADEMDEVIITNWNDEVADEDTVYMLGDFAFGRGSKEKLKLYLPQLKGRIILIRGNHDHETVGWYKRYGVADVHGGEVWKYEPYVLLSHRPYPTKHPWMNIHGHTHNLMHIHPSGVYVNVSVEAIGYKPIDLDELIERVRKGGC